MAEYYEGSHKTSRASRNSSNDRSSQMELSDPDKEALAFFRQIPKPVFEFSGIREAGRASSPAPLHFGERYDQEQIRKTSSSSRKARRLQGPTVSAQNRITRILPRSSINRRSFIMETQGEHREKDMSRSFSNYELRRSQPTCCYYSLSRMVCNLIYENDCEARN